MGAVKKTLSRMRSFFSPLLCLFLFSLAGFPGFLRAGEPKKKPTEKTPLLSAAELAYPPFSFVDENGRAKGFSVELLRAALSAMGREATFRTGPWKEVRGWLERGEVEVLPLVGHTPEREALFDFTIPYMTLKGAIVVREDNRDIRGLEDLRGKRVAVMKGDNAEEFLRRGERGIEIRTTPTFKEAFYELSRKSCDAVVMQRLVALRLLKETGLSELDVVDKPVEEFFQDFCFAVREGDRETLALLNEGLAVIMADGTYRHLHSKWFAAMQLPSDRPILVGGDRNFPPFEYLDENGDPAGYNVDLTYAVAREMGLNVEVRLGLWKERIRALESGQIDVMQGMYYSSTRGLKFDFSPAHTVNHLVAVVRRENAPPPETIEELKRLRIVVEQDDIMHDYVEENGLSGRVTALDDQVEALKALAGGKFDCALVSRVTAFTLIEKHGWTRLVPAKKPLLSLDYCFAVPQGQQAVLAHFSEGLRVIKESGEYRRIHEKWLGVYEKEPLTFSYILQALAYIAGPLLLILFAMFSWSWSLRRQVGQKTRELRESLERFRHVFESANVGKSITLPSGEVNVNRAFAGYLGYTPEELKNKTWQELTPAEDIPGSEQQIIPLLEGKRDSARFEKRYLHKNGSHVWADVSVGIVRDNKDNPLYFVSTIVDITQRKRAEKALGASRELQSAMIACSPVALYSLDMEKRVLSWNAAAEKMFGWKSEEVLWKPLPIVPDDKRDEYETMHRRAAEGLAFSGIEVIRRRKNGTLFDGVISMAPIRNSEGEIIGTMGAMEDISERKIAEQKVVESESKFRLLVESSPEAIHVQTNGVFTYVNLATVKLFGAKSPEEILGTSIFDRIHPDFRETVNERMRTIGKRQAVTLREERYIRLDGSVVDVEVTAVPIQYEGEEGALVFVRDISERILREKAYRNLQDQLNQAQKMESVGRLAGGVAHDFNNMLSLIIGYTEMGLDKVKPDNPLHQDLREILYAGERSAEITRQLLAFARKQNIVPRILDLNETVGSMLNMLRRLIGESIEMCWIPGNKLGRVRMDRSQVNQLLANLCVNARDAISDVGTITIETANVYLDEQYCRDHAEVTSGEYVLLAVSDNGKGMDRDTQNKIFEPFFTTKEVGQGTGLGLATVYGIVRQNNGFINVYSEPGKGTTFRIYIPGLGESPKVDRLKRNTEISRGKGETILIVEDEDSILKLGTSMLTDLGYRVLSAKIPEEALELVEKHENDIDLLITDVVMPRMNGRELAERLRSRFPGLKVLYMSGYTANVIAHHGILEEDIFFLQKPFSKRELAEKVRDVLCRDE
jgi:PAS domain S-box-containing protein